MKIINVTPGILPIPPKGWGAVEKIIWEVHNNLLALGHDSHITYLNDVPRDADIVHIHVANLALIARDMGIPYYFTCHDHHAYLYGKASSVYQENLEAMRHAVKAFVPAKYLVDYFEGIPEYFSHGVNTLFFSPSTVPSHHKLLCVANNGYIHNQSEDRKGFGIAIEAARALGLPITIAGPSNNKKYFEQHPPTYDKLTILYDLTEEELRDLYKSHTIFVHPSETEAGHPNLTLLEALASGLPVVGTLEPNNSLGGMRVTSRDVVDVTMGIQEVILKYEQFRMLALRQAERLSWHDRTKQLVSVYEQKDNITMRTQLISHYNNTTPLHLRPRLNIRMNAIDGMFVEILGTIKKKYRVLFKNTSTGNIEYVTEMENNCWARCSIDYYVDWDIIVEDITSNETYHYSMDFTDERIYIALDSKSVGDTLAWIPYVEEFRKKHNCKVICSTFHNDLFRESYPFVEFVSPGSEVHNIMAMYTIGLFYTQEGPYNAHQHPRNPATIPLQQIASDILGLEYMEIRPRLPDMDVEADDRLITIAIHSTAQAKYWNNTTGWQEVVDWLLERGYTVKLLSQEEDGYMGNNNPVGAIQFPKSSIEDVIVELKRSKFFIGLSSGLSWLSWAAGIPTVLISGFTDPVTEMKDCIRISAPVGKCSGCWSRHKFNPGDWNWCPDHKGTPRQFECSKSITAADVISAIQPLINR